MKVLKFSAGFCQPCKVITQQLDQLGARYEEFDIEDNPEKFKAFGVRNVPTLVLLDDNGIEQNRLTGAQPLAKLKAFLSNEQ